MDDKIQIDYWLESAAHDMAITEEQFSRIKEMYQWLLLEEILKQGIKIG